MKRILIGSAITMGLVAGCFLGGGPRVAAQEPAKSESKKVQAEKILDREAVAKGGDANQKIKTFAIKLKISTGDNHLQLTMNYAGPNKHRLELAQDGTGSVDFVVKDKRAWTNDSINGARVLDDQERQQSLAKAESVMNVFRFVGNWRKYYKQVELVGEEKIDGKLAYKVQVTTNEGMDWIDYFDKTSSLLVRRDITGKGETLITTYSDYRTVNGIVQPFTTRIVSGSTETVITMEHFSHNVEIPESLFTLPEALKIDL